MIQSERNYPEFFHFYFFLRCKGYTAQQDIIFTPLNFYDSFLRNVIQRDFLWHQFLPEYARVPRSVVLSSKDTSAQKIEVIHAP